MRKLWVMAAVVLLASATRARAAVVGEERIELRPPTVTIDQLEPTEQDWFHLSTHLAVEEGPRDLVPGLIEATRGPLEIRLPEMPPEKLDLRVRYERLLFLVGAEVTQGDGTWSPRLDCDSRETYFWIRLSYDVDEHWSVFLETFQAANAILGWDPRRAYQGYVWDGAQLHAGLVYRLNGQIAIEGGPVLYALSATQKPSSVGVSFALSVDF